MIDAAIEELKTHQTQLDMDGVMVGVSRQALEELLEHVAARAGHLVFTPGSPRPDNSEPVYTRAQLEAHAADQVRPLVEALEGLIEAVELDADEGLEGIGSYTGARLTDAKNAIRARGQV